MIVKAFHVMTVLCRQNKKGLSARTARTKSPYYSASKRMIYKESRPYTPMRTMCSPSISRRFIVFLAIQACDQPCKKPPDLAPGDFAAHAKFRLLLLPSGPDKIHGMTSHETRWSSIRRQSVLYHAFPRIATPILHFRPGRHEALRAPVRRKSAIAAATSAQKTKLRSA